AASGVSSLCGESSYIRLECEGRLASSARQDGRATPEGSEVPLATAAAAIRERLSRLRPRCDDRRPLQRRRSLSSDPSVLPWSASGQHSPRLVSPLAAYKMMKPA